MPTTARCPRGRPARWRRARGRGPRRRWRGAPCASAPRVGRPPPPAPAPPPRPRRACPPPPPRPPTGSAGAARGPRARARRKPERHAEDRASAVTAPSSALRSSVPTAATASGARPASARAARVSARSSPGGQPREAPTPSAATWGRSAGRPGARGRGGDPDARAPGERGQPRRLALHIRALAREEARHGGSCPVRVREAPAVGRIVERDPEGRVARRGDGGRDAQRLRDPPRERVGPPVAAQEGHHG
jgi:hypothetical protein